MIEEFIQMQAKYLIKQGNDQKMKKKLTKENNALN